VWRSKRQVDTQLRSECVFEAVPAIYTDFLVDKVYNEDCTGLPLEYYYYRLDTCSGLLFWQCSSDSETATRKAYVIDGCEGDYASTLFLAAECKDDSVVACPVETYENIAPKPKHRTDSTTTAIVVVSGLMIAGLAGLVIYFRRQGVGFSTSLDHRWAAKNIRISRRQFRDCVGHYGFVQPPVQQKPPFAFRENQRVAYVGVCGHLIQPINLMARM